MGEKVLGGKQEKKQLLVNVHSATITTQLSWQIVGMEIEVYLCLTTFYTNTLSHIHTHTHFSNTQFHSFAHNQQQKRQMQKRNFSSKRKDRPSLSLFHYSLYDAPRHLRLFNIPPTHTSSYTSFFVCSRYIITNHSNDVHRSQHKHGAVFAICPNVPRPEQAEHRAEFHVLAGFDDPTNRPSPTAPASFTQRWGEKKASSAFPTVKSR